MSQVIHLVTVTTKRIESFFSTCIQVSLPMFFFMHQCVCIKNNINWTKQTCNAESNQTFPWCIALTHKHNPSSGTHCYHENNNNKKNTLTRNCGPPCCELLEISFYWLEMFIGYKVKFITAVITPLSFLFARLVRKLFQFKIRIAVTWNRSRREQQRRLKKFFILYGTLQPFANSPLSVSLKQV